MISKQQQIINFINKNFQIDKQEFLNKYNITEQFLENNTFINSFKNEFQHFKFFNLYINKKGQLCIKNVNIKVIKNKKFIALKLLNPTQTENAHRDFCYSFTLYKEFFSKIIADNNPDFFSLFLMCKNFDLFSFISSEIIDLELIKGIYNYIQFKNNISNF